MALRAALLASALLSVAGAVAHDVTAGDLLIADAWARPTPPGISVGAVYLGITNSGAVGDRLTAVTSPLAAQGEIHETRSQAGVMNMRPVSFLEIPAHGTVKVSPGGIHIMLLGLTQPLVPGTEVALALTFQRAGRITLSVPVQARQ